MPYNPPKEQVRSAKSPRKESDTIYRTVITTETDVKVENPFKDNVKIVGVQNRTNVQPFNEVIGNTLEVNDQPSKNRYQNQNLTANINRNRNLNLEVNVRNRRNINIGVAPISDPSGTSSDFSPSSGLSQRGDNDEAFCSCDVEEPQPQIQGSYFVSESNLIYFIYSSNVF